MIQTNINIWCLREAAELKSSEHFCTTAIHSNLLLSGDIELNPGQSKTTLKVKKPVTNVQSKNLGAPF